MKKESRFSLSRVDVQVSLIATIAVVFSCVLLYLITYNFAYNDMISTLAHRVESIVNYVEGENFDLTIFDDIDVKEDVNDPRYIASQKLFGDIRAITNAKYLYTAKREPNGTLIYLIDGLPMDNPDFRYPGDPIEPDFIADLNTALTGERVMPNEILHTEWGDVFVAYVPVHNETGDVIGVIGVEFSAESQYKTFLRIRQVTPIIILFSCFICALFSVVYFRRISNPRYQDLSNTDYLTQLKSRNAFEVDLHNREVQNKLNHLGIISMDLNGLKKINDSNGHETGDKYLKCFADSLKVACATQGIPYRVGGDEFMILVDKATDEQIEEISTIIAKEFKQRSQVFENAAYSIGYAICNGNRMEQFKDAVKLADQKMYSNKTHYYLQKTQL